MRSVIMKIAATTEIHVDLAKNINQSHKVEFTVFLRPL
jgi:hypothetical protein